MTSSLVPPGAGHAGNDGVIVRTVPLGGSVLSRALQAGDQEVRAFRKDAPAGVEQWRTRAHAVRRAQGVVDWHAQLAPAFAARGAAATRLAAAAEGGVVVTTGQQPGLFGGPAYTWSKALGALAFADGLQRAIGMPVAPVFWAATDDADWVEAATTYLLGPDGLSTLSLAGAPTDGVAMRDVPLGHVAPLLASLRAACGSVAGAAVLDAVATSYRDDATIGSAYLLLLRLLLEPLGIAVLDAAHPATRDAADGFLRTALAGASRAAAALSARTDAIRAVGHTPQVEVVADLSLVFVTANGVRERVPLVEAERVARDAPRGTLGANVLLRPVLERCLLPTVAYLAGPGEYAYFAQVGPIADALGAEAPLPLPRWAGEVIERRSLDLLDRLALDEAALHDPHAAETLLARGALDDGVQDALERLRGAVEAQSSALRAAIANAGQPVPATVVDGLGRDLAHRLDRFERRVVASVKRRETTLMRDIARARAAFRPLGTSPERVLNLIPVMARHGLGVLTLMRDAAEGHTEALLAGTSEAG